MEIRTKDMNAITIVTAKAIDGTIPHVTLMILKNTIN